MKTHVRLAHGAIFIAVAFLALYLYEHYRVLIYSITASTKDLALAHSYLLLTLLPLPLLNAVLYDIYFITNLSKYIRNIWSWLTFLAVSYALLALVAVLLYHLFRAIVYVTMTSGRIAPIDYDRIAIVLGILTLLLSLIYISLASVRTILLYKSVVSGLNPFKGLQKVLSTAWHLKGDFVIFILFGYVIASLLGHLIEFLTQGMGMITNPTYTGVPVLILNALVTYIYYAYFVRNYVFRVLEECSQ